MIFDRFYERDEETIDNSITDLFEKVLGLNISIVLIGELGCGKTTSCLKNSEVPYIHDPKSASEIAIGVVQHHVNMNDPGMEKTISTIRSVNDFIDASFLYFSRKFNFDKRYMSKAKCELCKKSCSIPKYCLRYEDENILSEETTAIYLFDKIISGETCPIFDEVFMKLDFDMITIDFSSVPRRKALNEIMKVILNDLSTKQVIITCTRDIFNKINKDGRLNCMQKLEIPNEMSFNYYLKLFESRYETDLVKLVDLKRLVEYSGNNSGRFLMLSSIYSNSNEKTSEGKFNDIKTFFNDKFKYSTVGDEIFDIINNSKGKTIKDLSKEVIGINDQKLRKILKSLEEDGSIRKSRIGKEYVYK